MKKSFSKWRQMMPIDILPIIKIVAAFFHKLYRSGIGVYLALKEKRSTNLPEYNNPFMYALPYPQV